MNENMDPARATNNPYEAAVDDTIDAYGTSAMDTGDADETTVIRVEIEETRAELADTIDAIQERLNPQTLMDQAKETVRDTATGVIEQAKETVHDATIGKAEQMVSDVTETARGTGSSILETIRRNPVPAALAAVGIGWLWMNRSSGSSNHASGYAGAYRRDYNYSSPSYQYQQRSGAGDGSIQETVRQTAGNVQDKAGQLVDRAQSGVSQMADEAQSGVSSLVEGTQQQAQRAQGQMQQMLQDTPLAVGGIALALGAAVGLAIPETQPEHRLMGEAHDTLMLKAQETAGETLGKVQDVAQKVGATAVDTAKDEVQAQGLAPR